MICITGNMGYIGSNLMKELACRKIPAKGFDIKRNVVEDIGTMNIHDLEGVETVIHCASSISVAESEQKQVEYYGNNVANTLYLMRLICRSPSVKNIIFSSTAAVYDSRGFTQKFKESDDLYPSSVYGRTKLSCEFIIKDIARQCKIKSFIFRYFNVAGCYHTGENHEPETHLIPNITKNMIKDIDVDIYGNDYATPDGTCIRDYIHIEDLVKAHMLILDKIDTLKSNTFNLGTSLGNSVLEVYNKCFCTIVSSKSGIQYKQRRAGDADILVCDNSKAKEILEWSPTKSLEDIILSDYNYRKTICD